MMSTQNTSQSDSWPYFSIIIPTFNEAEDIENTLNALLALDYWEYEILVVDDSTDLTPEIVQACSSDRVRYLRQTRGLGRSAARNQGILESIGDIVVVLNADVLVPDDFLRRLAHHYRGGTDYVLVDNLVSNTEYLIPRYLNAQHQHYYGPGTQVEMNWTEGFSCRRSAAIDVGMFPEGEIVPLVAGEDGWFGERLREFGFRKMIDYSLQIRHVAPVEWREFFRQRLGRGYGSTQVWALRDGIYGTKLVLHVLRHSISVLIGLIIVAPPVWQAWCLTRCSPLGLRDLFPFLLVRYLESVANTAGLWHGYRKSII